MKPTFWMIDDLTVKQIIEEAIDILEKIGIFVENQDALLLLKEAGAMVKGGRVFITRDLTYSCIATTPPVVEIYDRSGNLKMSLGDDEVYFVPGSTAVYFRDSQGKIGKPDARDYVRLIRITDFLPNIAAQSTAMIPDSVPAQVADVYRLYLSLLHSSKPIITGTFVKQNFELMKRALVAVRGSEEALRQYPLAIFDVCPSPPLKWSDLTCQALIDCARSGIPAELVAMPLAGAVAPVTLYGALVQHTAESLSGVVIHQLANRGAPIIYGGSPASFDMRYATASLGAIETMMIDCAYARIGKYLGLPTHAYMGVSDSKDVDSQMGSETGIGAVLAALSGINVVAGAGMLGSENCQSLEKLVFDNEICGMALRLARGIDQRHAPETERIIGECVKTGSFFEHPTTLQLLRQEQYIPRPFIDRTGVETWSSQQERKNLKEKLADEVRTILRNHNPVPLNSDAERELHNIWKRVAG